IASTYFLTYLYPHDNSPQKRLCYHLDANTAISFLFYYIIAHHLRQQTTYLNYSTAVRHRLRPTAFFFSRNYHKRSRKSHVLPSTVSQKAPPIWVSPPGYPGCIEAALIR